MVHYFNVHMLLLYTFFMILPCAIIIITITLLLYCPLINKLLNCTWVCSSAYIVELIWSLRFYSILRMIIFGKILIRRKNKIIFTSHLKSHYYVYNCNCTCQGMKCILHLILITKKKFWLLQLYSHHLHPLVIAIKINLR